jgi:predicted metal-binding membrane protein
VRHGLFCVGCCWALMAVLFVGGVMNLPWIAALALAVAVEKLVRGGPLVGAALGAALIVGGVVKLAVLF